MEKTFPEHVCEDTIFQELFFEYSRKLRNFLFYKCGDEALSEDLMQEAYLRMWKECKKVSYQKAKSFLFTVANNLFLDHVKHQKVVTRFKLIPISQSTPEDPQFLLEEKEFQGQLEEAIESLPEKQRVVFLMSRIEKMTYRDIAALLEISVKAVEKRMHKALIVLRDFSDKI